MQCLLTLCVSKFLLARLLGVLLLKHWDRFCHSLWNSENPVCINHSVVVARDKMVLLSCEYDFLLKIH